MAGLLNWVFHVVFLLAAIASLASFFGYTGWFCDLLSHFRIIWITLFASYGLIYFLRGTWRMGLLALLLFGFQFSQWLPFLPNFSLFQVSQKPATLTVLQLNLWAKTRNKKPELVKQLIEQTHPDIIALEEYDTDWHHQLTHFLSKRYPHHILRIGEENALYSQVALTNPTIWWTQHDHPVHENVESVITATMKVQHEPITVMVLHTLSPLKPHMNHHQQTHLAMLETHVSDMHPSAVLIGDLNTTPWSANYKRLIRNLQLIDSQEGIGIQASWPTWSPLSFLPIDHVLYRGRLRVVSRQLLPSVGSDHYPVLVKFALESVRR